MHIWVRLGTTRGLRCAGHVEREGTAIFYVASSQRHLLPAMLAVARVWTALLPLHLHQCCRHLHSHQRPSFGRAAYAPFVHLHRLCFLRPRFLPKMQSFWRGTSNDSKSLLENLRQQGVINSARVAEIMEKVDRGLFVHEREFAYMDSPMPIGYNATISAPHMHALCLELLQNHLKPGMHALDIGSGTGYLTACFALMVGEQGRVVGVEHIPELVEQSIRNVRASAAAPLLQSGQLLLHVGDGRNGWPDSAPYDAIHVGAAAPGVPEPLLQQLKPGGRMVIPVGDLFQDLQVIDKQPDGSLRRWVETSVRYVPLTSRSEQVGS